jgi:hypothetical protein
MRIYLIQRLEKPQGFTNPFNFGGGLKNGGLSDDAMKLIKNIFSFDYMGSAEFEYGAVPDAMNKIAKNHESYSSHEVKVKPKKGNVGNVYVICNDNITTDVISWIKKKGQDEYNKNQRTKEHVGLHESLTNDEFRIKGWLELDNAFFFFTDKGMYEKTKLLFGIE